ncbi:MAG: hypothetical protein WBN94_04195 [Methanothrix sp.]
MAETSNLNCGHYLKGAPSINYGMSVGVNLVKQWAIDLTEAISETVSGVSGIMNDFPYADEMYLNSAICLFSNMYNIDNDLDGPEIREFLQINTFLIPLLSEAYGRLQRYFPYDTVSMYVDQNTLVVSVRTDLAPRDARENLSKFDDEWWLDVCTESQAKLCITVEFQ